jgi:hypothetical protein
VFAALAGQADRRHGPGRQKERLEKEAKATALAGAVMLADVALEMGTFITFAVILPAAGYGLWLLIVRLIWGRQDEQ